MSLRWHTTRGVNHFYNYHNTTKTHDTKPAMSGRKLPPSQPTLTKMPRDDKKCRIMDDVLLSLIQNIQQCKLLSSRVVSTVRTQSTSLFKDGARGAIKSCSSSEESDDCFSAEGKQEKNKNVMTHTISKHLCLPAFYLLSTIVYPISYLIPHQRRIERQVCGRMIRERSHQRTKNHVKLDIWMCKLTSGFKNITIYCPSVNDSNERPFMKEKG